MGALKVFQCIVTVFYFISCIRAVCGGKILCSDIANHNDYILTDCIVLSFRGGRMDQLTSIVIGLIMRNVLVISRENSGRDLVRYIV